MLNKLSLLQTDTGLNCSWVQNVFSIKVWNAIMKLVLTSKWYSIWAERILKTSFVYYSISCTNLCQCH